MTEPLFMYSTRTQAKQIVHRTILGGSWSPRLALYVGQTNNLLRRMEQHGWSSSWFALVVDVRHQIVPAADALRIEAELIRDLDPPFNVVGRAA
jgi:hypothetical protein